MNKNRRQFIKLSAVVATGLALPIYSCDSANEGNNRQEGANASANTATGSGLDTFGIQLYTLKDEMARDPKEVLRQLSSFGYSQIESFEGQSGMFWGMKNTEFKSFIDELNLDLISSHTNFQENFEEKAAQAGEIGMRYLIAPWIGPQESIDAYKRMADRFNEAGEICKRNNLRFAYHNHDYTFKEQEGQIPQQVLMDNTDPELVDFELDMYWVVVAGADPQEYLRKYSDRFKLGHVKDRRKDATAEETHASTVLGTGTIDYQPILKTAQENGMEYFFVEQEEFKNTSPLESSRKNAEYLKNLRI